MKVGGFYFRRLHTKPKALNIGDRIFYVDDGYVTGFAIVSEILKDDKICELTGKSWGEGFYVIMNSESWKWIKPIKYKGFQGWRYFNKDFEISGNWKCKKPENIT